MNAPEPRTILVTGATGRLSSLAAALLDRGHVVRAMTRDPGSPTADRLRRSGAEVVVGDFDDPAGIASAARGAHAIFATGTAHRVGPEGELRHGLNLAAAAEAAGVEQLVYSSGDGAAPAAALPLFRAKHAIEERINRLAIRHTILAPVYFMENLFNPWNLAEIRAGRLPSPIAIDQPLQQVAIADLVAFAVAVLERPDEFANRRLALASDELTAIDAAAAFSAVTGRDLEPTRLDPASLPEGLRALFAWLGEVGHSIDVERLHRRYPDVEWHRYHDWLRSQRDRLRDQCPHVAAVG